jgi:protein-disulfide isomerase
MMRARASASSTLRDERFILLGTAAALVLAGAVGARLGVFPWQRPGASAAAPQAAGSAQRYQVPISMSQPKRGPEDAIVTIVEWCDFHGEKCKALAPIIDQTLAAYPTQLRHVFRHFTDKTAMPALEEHELAHLAFEHAGKFFEARALFMQAQSVATRAELERHAGTLGLDWSIVRAKLDKHAYAPAVVADVTFAGMFAVSEAPALFVNGRRLLGEPSFERLRRLIDDELAHAQTLVSRGVAKGDVYAALTKDGVWEKAKLERK